MFTEYLLSLFALSFGLNATTYNQGNNCFIVINVGINVNVPNDQLQSVNTNREAIGNQTLSMITCDDFHELDGPLPSFLLTTVESLNHAGLARYL